VRYIPHVEDRPLDEAKLVERAKDGDLQAYGALIEMHEGMAFRVAYLVTQNAADAEEAIQEAFFRAFAALGRFRRGAPFRPWLLRIVANEAKDRRKAARQRTALVLRAAEEPPRERDPSPEAAAIAADERARVFAALNRLSERERLVVAYRYLLGLSEAEMAAALDCARGTVKSRLARALEALRRELENEQ
jgi:RNA polymerase sigma factor (sigma-70 family)